MSEDNNETVATEIEAKSVREPKKNSIPFTEVEALTADVVQYDKASFRVVGHKNGVRLAVPLTTGVGRVYFYGNNDYSTVPDHAAIKVYSAEERKEQRLGGIMADIDFSQGIEAAKEALSLMIEAVRNAPVPQVKPKREPRVKAPAEAAAEPQLTEANHDPETVSNDEAST